MAQKVRGGGGRKGRASANGDGFGQVKQLSDFGEPSLAATASTAVLQRAIPILQGVGDSRSKSAIRVIQAELKRR
jgi:hypothetical protein